MCEIVCTPPAHHFSGNFVEENVFKGFLRVPIFRKNIGNDTHVVERSRAVDPKQKAAQMLAGTINQREKFGIVRVRAAADDDFFSRNFPGQRKFFKFL